MSEQGEEGQVPAPPGLEDKGELPPRPTVRESFRRGLFVRLPTEGETGEGLAGPEQGAPEQPVDESAYTDQGIAGQYPEQVADPYPGWRQAADGSWEAVSPEAYAYAEGYEPATPESYPAIDQGADFASIAGGEPFIHQDAAAEAAAPFTFSQEVPEATESAAASEEAPLAETPPVPKAEPEAAPAVEAEAEVTPEAEAVPEAAPAAEAEAEVTPEAEAVPEAAPETVPEAAAEVAPIVEAVPEAAPSAEPVPETVPASEDPVAAADLYIPADVELLEGDMPLYGEGDKVPPRFTGSGLGEPRFIEFEDLSKTLVGLRRLLPKGTRLTYNFDHERAWVRTSEEIDLPSFVERVQAQAAEGEEASA
ncbi:MAG: hypothetical protein ABSC36_02465 [Gaiellaceae bacterium]|jgi:hypothetical protein